MSEHDPGKTGRLSAGDAAILGEEIASLSRAGLTLPTGLRALGEGTPATIPQRVQQAAGAVRGTGRPTKTAQEMYQIASDELAVEIPKLRRLVETDIRGLEKQLDAAGAPPTPGRLPDMKK